MPEKLNVVVGWYMRLITDPQSLSEVPSDILSDMEKSRIHDKFYGFLTEKPTNLQNHLHHSMQGIGTLRHEEHSNFVAELQCRAFAEELADCLGFAAYQATALSKDLPGIAVARQAQIGTSILKATVEKEFSLLFST